MIKCDKENQDMAKCLKCSLFEKCFKISNPQNLPQARKNELQH